MVGSILGTRVKRVEDPHLLIGKATYVDNIDHGDALYCHFVRSTVAYAEITKIDIESALQQEGVIGIFLNADLDVDPFIPFFELNPNLKRTPLAQNKVHYVGDPIILIVATSKSLAIDAAEFVEITYTEISPVVDKERAFDLDATLIDPNVPMNMAASVVAENSSNPLSDASVIVRAKIRNQRMAVAPMEPNSIAVHLGENETLTIFVSTQMPHFFANRVESIFDLEKDKLRVVSPDVGGGFGGKAGVTAEHIAVIAASMKLKHSLRWLETREENLLSMQGRDQVQFVELGTSLEGKITGLRARMIGDAGAYGGFGGGLVIGSTKSMAQGVYEIPKISFRAVVASTNTPPIGALRGAGRPEAASFLERIIDIAAHELNMDPIDFRLKNLIPSESFPYKTLMGTTYDSGNYRKALDRVRVLANYDELRREQRIRIEAGNTELIGVGVSCYVEITAGGGPNEFGAVEITDQGRAVIRVGTSGHGQGHATTFSMLVSDTLGIPLEDIDFIQSDTREVPRGGGTGGSRSLQLGGNAVKKAAVQVLEIAKLLVADNFEANPNDVEVSETGGLEISGSPEFRMSWRELATLARDQGSQLSFAGDFTQGGATFPFGAHISIVKVDTETGKVTPISHFAVDDCGTIVNPMVVEGQQHGGIAQGIGQALYEDFQFDEYGNPKNTSFADYLMTSAAEMPNFVVENIETPSPLNPIGAKGIGESATVGSTPAVQNAVVDALWHLGVRHIDMPMTPERVWTAIAQGKTASNWTEPGEIFQMLDHIIEQKTDAADIDI